MDVISQALSELLTQQHFLYLLAGVLIGMIVGILPGMGGVAGMALLLPFVYGMEPTSALALMIGMLATTATGDTFPSILMGIPGGSSSATVLDGFPLARQGHAARALSASFTASLLGGILGALVLSGCVFVAKPLIIAVGMGEQLLLVILALSMVGMLTGTSPIKGLASCGLGLLIATIGSAPATGEVRYTFGTVYLSDGIPLVALALGIFALPEIVDLMRRRSTIADVPKLGSGWRHGVVDVLRNWWLVIRVSGIGALIGILPGVGASTADWLAYGHVVQTSKHRDKFGQGDIRGVIAPEAANNAVRGGDLVPTLFFGIPGSGSMALLLGGFVLIGLRPGARMIGPDLDLTFVIIWSLALANIFGAVLCILLANPIAKLTLVRYAFLAPLITVLMVLTTFQATRDWGDVLALLLLAFVGVYMKRFDWSRPALVVGFVLSPGLEASIYQTTQVYGFSFLLRPQSMLLLVLVLASIAVGVRAVMRGRASSERPASAPTTRFPQIVFTAVLMAVVAYALVTALGMGYLTRIYPVAIAAITIALLGLTLLQQWLSGIGNPVLADLEQAQRAGRQGQPSKFVYLAWFWVYAALIALFGFTIASLVFVFAFITLECGRPLVRNAVFAVATAVTLMIMAGFLYLEFPRGYLEDLVTLPWWIG